MDNTGKLLSALADLLGYWLRAAGLATAFGLRGPLAAWVLGQLALRPADRVLELGCGPDMVMKAILDAHKTVFVAAVDQDPERIARAWRQNTRAIAAGRAMLIQTGTAASLPAFASPFTKAVAVNAAGLADQPAAVLEAMRAALAPGGQIVLVFQPADQEDGLRLIGKEFHQHLVAAGFTSVQISERPAQPGAAVSISGVVPSGAGDAANHAARPCP